MSCVLYNKEGKAIKCEIGEIEYHLQNGYMKDHPDRKMEHPKETEIESEIKEKESELESKDEEIRDLARQKGLKRVGKKKIETLLEELSALEGVEDASED